MAHIYPAAESENLSYGLDLYSAITLRHPFSPFVKELGARNRHEHSKSAEGANIRECLPDL
jgi:hypothetical protein